MVNEFIVDKLNNGNVLVKHYENGSLDFGIELDNFYPVYDMLNEAISNNGGMLTYDENQIENAFEKCDKFIKISYSKVYDGLEIF